MTGFNEYAVEQESRGRGRPPIDDEEVFNNILAKPETRQQFIDQITYLVGEHRKLENVRSIYSADVKGTKEALGLSQSFINNVVKAVSNQEVDKQIAKAVGMADILSIFQKDEE